MDPKLFQVKLDALAVSKTQEAGILKVVKITAPPSPCEWGCGPGGCTIESRLHKANSAVRTEAHWRYKCTTCDHFINPKTGRTIPSPKLDWADGRLDQKALRHFYFPETVKD